MHTYIRIKSTIFLLLLLVYSTVIASIDHNIIQKIQAHLNKMDKIAIEFLQIDKNNVVAEGQLLIQKPYFFRCNYYPPYPLLITGGKKYITLYDFDMETISYLEKSENIIDVIFQLDWLNNENYKVLDTKEENPYFMVKILHLQSQKQAELFFNKKTLNLVKINIFEIDEITLVINFATPILVKRFEPEIFEIKNPQIFGKPIQFDKENIKNIYDSD